MDTTLLNQLAKRLLLTDLEPETEEYILTSEDEAKLVENAIESAKQLHIFRRVGVHTKAEVDHQMAQINWDEQIDKAELFKRGNANKLHDLWQKNQRAKEKEEETQRLKLLQETWTAKKVYSQMCWASINDYGKELIVDDDNKKLISALCFFISNDKRLVNDLSFSPNKGLLIRGAAGVGKTHLVKCAAKNAVKPIQVLSMIEITDEIRLEGGYELITGDGIVYLDDVGTEEAPIQHYGTKINFFKNFIEKTYLNRSVFNGLIISTNLNWKGIEEKYGFRVVSRMRDMFNVIDVSGKDKRNDSK